MNKIASFFEAHVEKIILVIVGLVCIWLMITRVIFSPNQVKYGDAKYSPAAIDERVHEQALELRQKFNSPPEGIDSYKPRLTEYLALLDSSVKNIDVNMWPQVPYAVGAAAPGMAAGGKGGKYSLPVVGAVTEVDIEHIRAAAYVPTVAITAENQYDKAENEPNDIDLITVEAKFDIAQLYERFKQCFVDDVEEQYSDPCFAKPVFAAVQLQRQELTADGIWSDWKNIPRAKIDHYGALFDIVEDAEKLPPGWLNVRKLQFDDWQLQIDLLQPEAYAMASAKEEWYPPVIHRKFLSIQSKEEAEERRQAREDERNSSDRTDSRRRRNDMGGGIGGGASSGRTNRRTRGGTSDMGGAYGGGMGGDSRRRSSRGGSRSGGTGYDTGMGMGGTGDRRRGRSRTGRADQGLGGVGMEDYGMLGMQGDSRLTRRGPSMNDVYMDFDEISLNAMTELEKMKEPLVFWAHDDTVEPRKSYRYRIRLGVFNPIAGTDQLSAQDISRKNEVVLWSEFSDITKPVEIPGRMYFFAKHIREPANVVTVQVSKYVLGYWYSEDFKVSKGEVIGDVVEPELENDRDRRRSDLARGMMDPRMGAGGRTMTDPRMMSMMPLAGPREKSVVPETIDFNTGAVLVDTVAVNDWAGDKALQARHYYNMLYSTDGTDIEHMPVRTSYWAKDIRDIYGKISVLEGAEREPFKQFSAGRRSRPGMGGDGYDMMYEGGDYMYEDMGGMSPY